MSANSSPPLGDTPATKGTFRGLCNRTACQSPGAVYYNQSTRRYYCGPCAILLNRENSGARDMFGSALCVGGLDPAHPHHVATPVSEGTPECSSPILHINGYCESCGKHHWNDSAPSPDAGAGATPTAMTDFTLAAELMATAAWVSAQSWAVGVHLDRLARAMDFLKGVRTGKPYDVRWLTMNDTVCYAIATYVRQESARRIAEAEERVDSITSAFVESQTALHFANEALTTLHLQHAEQAAKAEVIFGAGRLAGAVDRLVRSGKLDARSEAGDALLDYAASRHGDREPIIAVRRAYDVILSKLDAARSSPSGGEPV